MFVFLSKFLPAFVYPLGLATLLLAVGWLFLRRKPRVQFAFLAAAFLILFIGGNRWVSSALARSLEWQYLPTQEPPNSEVIVVLGGGTETALPPRPMVEINSAGNRVLYAARLYRQGKAPHILLSGGSIDFMGPRASSPAQEMADVLVFLGVPSDALWLENQSQNTYENALYSAQMLRQKGITRVILVTSAMHMPRSVALFKHQGIEVIPAPADFSITQAGWDDLWKPDLASFLVNLMPTTGSMGLTTDSLKEYLGIWIYHLRGWL